jgi:hypothetical protein
MSITHRRESSPLWLCRFDRLTLRRANACSGQANHFSSITLRRALLELVESNACLYRACRDAQGGPLTFHFSPFTNPPPSHFSRPRCGPAVRFQDLFLAFLRHRSWSTCGTGRLWSCAQPLEHNSRQRLGRVVPVRRPDMLVGSPLEK